MIAIIDNLERVVTVPTSVVHFAGALGIPTDVISVLGSGEVQNAVNYRFGMPGDTKMRWHDSVKVYRSIKEWTHKTRILIWADEG